MTEPKTILKGNRMSEKTREENFSFAYLYGLIALLPAQQFRSARYYHTVAEIRRQCGVIGITSESRIDPLELIKEVRAEEVRRGASDERL